MTNSSSTTRNTLTGKKLRKNLSLSVEERFKLFKETAREREQSTD
jgi:hypothetical protein